MIASLIQVNPCIKCLAGSGKIVCGGCQQWLCFKHFTEHRQDFAEQMDYLVQQHQQLRDQAMKSMDESFQRLINRINEWEERSIQRIQQVANEVRYELQESIDRKKRKDDESLRNIAEALQNARKDENYTEIDLNKWMDQLNRIRQQVDNQLALTIIHDREETATTIQLIQLRVKQIQGFHLITATSQWSRSGRTVAGRCKPGNELHLLHFPYGLYIDHCGMMLITDSDNHRILQWKYQTQDGKIIIGRKGKGNRTDQLNLPAAILIDPSTSCLIISEYGNRRVMRWHLGSGEQYHEDGEIILADRIVLGLAVDDEGSLYLSDYEKHEVRRYGQGDPIGMIVAGGNGSGDGLNQLYSPRHICVDEEFSLYISDSDNHRVMKWRRNAKEGVVVAGGNGRGNRLNQLNRPNGVFVDSMGSVYVVDQGNSRIMRWLFGEIEGEIIVGGHGHGSQRNQLHQPSNISVDQKGNLYVVDTSNHRIQRFDILSHPS